MVVQVVDSEASLIVVDWGLSEPQHGVERMTKVKLSLITLNVVS